MFFWIASISLAQSDANSTIDSLKQVIANTASPTEKGHALVILADQYSLTNIDTMPILCNEALQLYYESKLQEDDVEKIGLRSVAAEAFNNLGYYHLRRGNLDEARPNLLKSIEISQEVGFHSNLVSSGINLSLVYAEEGDYKYAIEILEQSEQLAEAKELYRERGTILNNIGWIYQTLKEYDGALKYYREAYSIQKKLGNQASLSAALNNIGVVYGRIGELDSAKHYYEAAFQIREDENSIVGLANSYGNLGHISFKLGDTLKAIDYHKLGLELCRKHDFKRQWMNTLNAYGKLLVAQGDLKTAKSLLVEMDTVLPRYSTPVSKREYLQLSYLYHAEVGNYKRAFNDYESYNLIRDSSQMNNMKYELLGRELTIENETEKLLLEERHQNELVLKEAEKKRENQVFYLVIIGLVVVLTLVIFLFKNVRQRQKITKLDLELTTTRNQKLEVEMGQQSKELAAYTLRVAQSNQFVQKVDDIISSLNSSTKEELEVQLRSLKSELNLTKQRDKDWVEFQRQFEGVHTSFIENLTQQFPSLTTTEVRLCTLMKLNLPSKDIASVLGISPNTLKSSRYRIHKKLDLNEGEKLADFLLRFN